MWSPMAQPDGSIRYKNTVVPFPQMGKPRLCLGGLLADDMGLGKTLSVLALITTHLDHVDDAGLIQDDVHPKMTTLIICPLSLLLTWEDQIKSHIHPTGVSYHIYHGPGRQKPLDELRNYHVILTTYDTIAAEGRKDFSKIAKVDKGILSLEWGRIVLDEGKTFSLKLLSSAANIAERSSLDQERNFATLPCPTETESQAPVVSDR
ncbi:hypothetical protein IQ06DRAFT_36521 [Neofusicoccum parvum]|uniref:Uncharacterized protein n=1 Tax=Neofusicoccum parvum TaxID=310453 RepID=A0ACB5SK62_9PEZI|nr:hypothetical protein IQ06DRAFT_36521 [Neofusicoccum parvum]